MRSNIDFKKDQTQARVVIKINHNDSKKARKANLSYVLKLRENWRCQNLDYSLVLINLNYYFCEGDKAFKRSYSFIDDDGDLYIDHVMIVDVCLPCIFNKTSKEDRIQNEMERFFLNTILQDEKFIRKETEIPKRITIM